MLAGTRLLIHPGGLASPQTVFIGEACAEHVGGLVPIGRAAEFGPRQAPLLLPAVVTLPFDPNALPVSVHPAEIVVAGLAADDRPLVFHPAWIDMDGGLVQAKVPSLMTYWAAAPDAYLPLDYLPLGHGDHYLYQSGLELTVTRSSREPGLVHTPIVKLTFRTSKASFGFYLEVDRESNLLERGDFHAGRHQELFDLPARFLDARETVGMAHEDLYSYLGYEPFGAQKPSYHGTGVLETENVERTSAKTVAGTFTDVVETRFTTASEDSEQRQQVTILGLWLARGVGPVRIQFDHEPAVSLVSGIVNGRSVKAR